MTLESVLPKGSSRRTAAGCAAVTVAVLLFCAFALPNGAPNGILLLGAVTGARQALLAAGIILVYRSARIVNFAQGVLGAIGAGLMFELCAVLGLPFPLGFVAALLMGALFGALAELLFVRRFFRAPRLVLTVVTIVLVPVLGHAAGLIQALPLWPRGPDVTQLRGLSQYRGPFEGLSVRVFPITFGFPEVLTFVLCVAAFAGLAAFFRYSRIGAAVRGAAENADRALMLGINVGLLSTLVWTLAGLLSSTAAVLQGMTGRFDEAGVGSAGLLVPLAAAVFGRMRNLPITIVAAVTLGIVNQAVLWSFPRTSTFNVVVLGIIAVGLLLQRRQYSRIEEGLSSSWQATQELRPTPKELLAVAGIRRAKRGILAAVLVFVAVFPFAFSPTQVNLASLIFIQAIIALSLVVMTGWGGQVSLGQFALVAVGAAVGSKLTVDIGVPFVIALPVTAAVTGGFAALIGLPALRIRGAFLAVTTLAFAVAVERVLFDESLFGWLIVDSVERPNLFFVSVASEQNFYFLCLALLVLSAVVVRRLRAGRTGRVLIALREDERGVQTFAIDATRTRLSVFALSGTLCGIAGMLFAFQQRGLDAKNFTVDASIQMFIMAMIGGVTSVLGAVLGAAFIGITNFLIADPPIRQLSSGFGLLALLFIAPGGLAAVAMQARDAVLRLVAIRRRMVVPSLFEDVDPEAILNQKTVLAPRIDGRGADALPAGVRYAQRSELYAVNGRAKQPVIPGGAR